MLIVYIQREGERERERERAHVQVRSACVRAHAQVLIWKIAQSRQMILMLIKKIGCWAVCGSGVSNATPTVVQQVSPFVLWTWDRG